MPEIAPRSVRAKLCHDVLMRVAETREERQAAFELIYRSYVQAGLCAEQESGLRATPYQLLPSTDIFVAELRGEIISTVSLVRDGELGLPMESLYPDEVARRRSAGVRLAEVSCLADRRQATARFFGLFCELSRLMAQLARKTEVDELVVVVNPRHAPLYRRYMAFDQIGDVRDYDAVEGKPAVPLSLNFAKAKIEKPKSWSEFFGTALPDEALQRCPISLEDRLHFRSILEATQEQDQFPGDATNCGGAAFASDLPDRLLCA